MQVEEIMTTNPACCTPESSLVEATRLMIDYDCGEIPVVGDLKSCMPVGVITDRDIAVRCVAEGHDPLATTAQELVHSEPIWVYADSDIADVLDTMRKEQLPFPSVR